MLFVLATCLMALVAPTPVAPGELAAAISAASAGDTLELAGGTFSGADCDQTVVAAGITIAGQGEASTIIDCPGVALYLKGNGTMLSALAIIRTTAAGSHSLVRVAAPAATFHSCRFSGGVIRKTGGFAWGGAISIDCNGVGCRPPFAYVFSASTFEGNAVQVSQAAAGDVPVGGGGGAINMILGGGGTALPSLIQIGPGTTFSGNSVRLSNVNATTGGSITGGALNINADGGPFDALLLVKSCVFAGNALTNIAPACIGGTAIQNDLISVAGGGAISLMTVKPPDPRTPGQVEASGASFAVHVSDSVFVENVAEARNCATLNCASNGGGMALLGAINVTLADGTRFERNTCRSTSFPSANSTGEAEGGAVFLQGTNPVVSGVQLAAANIFSAGTVFEGNSANCTGTSCISAGGALALDPVLSASFTGTAGTNNSAVCSGNVCTAMGGWLAVVDGPNATDAAAGIGCFDSQLVLSASQLCGNSALAMPPPPGWDTPCQPLPNPLGPCCYGTFAPIMGGAVAVQNLGCVSKITVTANDTGFTRNMVSNSVASACGPISYGAAFGAFNGIGGLTDIRGGDIAATFNSCEFTCNAGVCQPQGVSSNPVAAFTLQGNLSVAGATALAIPMEPKPAQSISFGGNGCAFSELPPAQAHFVTREKTTVFSAPVSVSRDCTVQAVACVANGGLSTTSAPVTNAGGGCAVGTGCAVGLGVGLGLGVPLLAGLAHAAMRRGQYGYGRTRAMLSGNAACFNDDRGHAQPSSSAAPATVKATPAPSGYQNFGPGSLRTSHNAL